MPPHEEAAPTTILFTDLVESTAMLQREGDENARRIFGAHHRLLGDSVRRHGGREVKWLGDGLMAVFPSAAAAVRCAVDMQQAARLPGVRRPLGVRIGLHVGESLRDEADYFGTAVVVARRMCDRAEAGQILCSSLVMGLLLGRQAFVFADRGPYELKGIDAPVHVFEALYEPLPAPRIALLEDVDGRTRRNGPRLRVLALAVGGAIALAGAAAFAAMTALPRDDGADGRAAAGALQPAASPTPARIAATSLCGAPGSQTCRGDWTISPEADETGMRLDFSVTFRSETDCVATWRSDLVASLQAFDRGEEGKYVVVDVNGGSHRLKQVGGLAGLTSDLPCNIPQLGWWEFDPVPPGPAQFHYPDFEQPISFVVPEAPASMHAPGAASTP